MNDHRPDCTLYHPQSGFTLIEAMLGTTVGLLLLGGIISTYIQTSSATNKNLLMAHVNQETRGVMDLMMREIRRAGYGAAVVGTDDMSQNPFWDITISKASSESEDDSCILFSYDLDEDYMLGVDSDGAATSTTDTDNSEQFGFRLKDNTIETRTGSNPFDCDSGTWTAVTDSSLSKVTSLTFTLTEDEINASNPGVACTSGSNDYCLFIRKIAISLKEEMLTDDSFQYEAEEIVYVRNDRFEQML